VDRAIAKAPPLPAQRQWKASGPLLGRKTPRATGNDCPVPSEKSIREGIRRGRSNRVTLSSHGKAGKGTHDNASKSKGS